MKDALQQAEIIDRGKEVSFPLNQIVFPLGIPALFSAPKDTLTFHELELNEPDLEELIPALNVSEKYKYFRTLVVKREGRPMIAFCQGMDEADPNDLPVNAIFNLTDPNSYDVLLAGIKIGRLENNHPPAGGLNLADIQKEYPKDKLYVEIASNRIQFLIDFVSYGV